jgi:nucleoside-diphosphate-sugar epimerase
MEYVLITGANGEVGHGLINQLKKDNKTGIQIIALDINGLDPTLHNLVDVFVKGSVTDKKLIEDIFKDYKINTIYHLAAVLSTSGEKNPEMAHEVNVDGTFNLLKIANISSVEENRVIKFLFPSTIAVYGFPDLKTKSKYERVNEDEFLRPITIYGINKLYCENLGVYYSTYYKLLSNNHKGVDFRCVRFPGLISADTIPSGGTSDYAPEMLHAAAQGKSYECFVRGNSKIHFMAMPDAINAMLLLKRAPKRKLSRSVYNIRGFSATAKEIEMIIKKRFPKANISYKVNPERQKIIDSWNEDVDDSKAVLDWGWKAKYNFKKAFEEYLIPAISKKYL